MTCLHVLQPALRNFDARAFFRKRSRNEAFDLGLDLFPGGEEVSQERRMSPRSLALLDLVDDMGPSYERSSQSHTEGA